MPTITTSSVKKVPKVSRKKIIVGSIVVLVLIGGYFLFHHTAPTYQFVTAKKGSIVETVSVTGNTTPTSSVSLGFGNSGTVAQVYSSVGKNVTKGQVLAVLNTSDLYAQIKQAQASVDTQEANYQKVINGATGTDIDVAKTAVETAKTNLQNVTNQQTLAVQNAYTNLLNSTIEAVPSSGSSDSTAPTISGSYTLGKEGTMTIDTYYSGDGTHFSVSGLASGDSVVSVTTAQPLGNSGLYIKFPSTTMSISRWIINIPNKKAANYITNSNAYQAAIQTKQQLIDAAQASLDQAQATLALKASSARPEDIAQAKAQVDSAQAGLQSIEAKLENSKISAPISGVITQFDAKIGQFASPGTPLVSIISGDSFEIDALVSETDIGKISLDNKITMTLDAFPGETFAGSVFYIDPAQTTTQGVVGYKIKAAFDKTDPRMKSGLTANLDISTRAKDAVLILPQYAILQNDEGTFVEVLEADVVKDIPVTLGLQDKDGNVEVSSGVTEGEQVLNIGLKQK